LGGMKRATGGRGARNGGWWERETNTGSKKTEKPS
jgi:hypothetical protein